MSPARPVYFTFPNVTEEQLRRDRLRAFWSSAAVALGPYVAGVFWRLLDSVDWSVVYLGIPDLALAGIVVSIAAYSNTLLSFTKLDGWEGLGTWTFTTASIVALLAFLCVIQYFKAAYAPNTQHNTNLLFYIAMISMIGTIIFSYLLQHAFVSDECRGARAARLRLL